MVKLPGAESTVAKPEAQSFDEVAATTWIRPVCWPE